MSADLRLVAHAAEGDADELAVEGAGDGAAERGLADAGRSDEAEDRPLHLLAAQLAHGEVFEDALLDLLEVVVILVEDLAGAGEIVVVGRHHAPRQAGHPVEIGADDRGLGGVGMRALQPLDLLLDLFLRLGRDQLLFDFLAVVLDFLGELFPFAELGLNGLELLAQGIIMSGNTHKRGVTAILGLILVVFGFILGTTVLHSVAAPVYTAPVLQQAVAPSTPVTDNEKYFSQIYNQVSPSVVSINVTGQSATQGNFAATGTGFVIDTDGHIVTNNHVVDGANQIEVNFLDGTIVKGSVVGLDPFRFGCVEG